MYRKSNYVLGAMHEPIVAEVKKKTPLLLILGSAAVLALLGRKAHRMKNAILGGVAAFAVTHFMGKPEVEVIVDGEPMPEDDSGPMEADF